MTRRVFVGGTVMAAAASKSVAVPAPSRLGIASTCYLSYWRPKDTLEFVEHCAQLGAAGVQTSLSSLDAGYLDRVKQRLDQTGMYIEVMCGMPRTDVEGFTRTLEAARRVGALCARSACLGGRRYETFSSLDDWRRFVSDSEAAIARAVPIAERLKTPFAIENHKDWTVDELVGLMKKYSSEYFGVCVDTGNNIALLDDPMEVIERLAPYAITTHVKDMGVAWYPDGFLLSEVVMGQGFLDMKRIVDTIHRARPAVKMNLEMITRDPLKVPCFTDKYWVAFPDRNGKYLARTMRLVQEKKSASLPSFSQLPKQQQLKIEDDNVIKCLEAARTVL